MDSTSVSQLGYSVPGVSCEHCRVAITGEIESARSDAEVTVDLDARQVTVSGPALDDATIRAAIEEAGYDVA